MTETLVEVETSRVRPGMFVHLDLKWMEHPFPWNGFKVRSEEDVRVLRNLGLKTVRYCLKRSDIGPLDEEPDGPGVPAEVESSDLRKELAAAIEAKRKQREYLARYRAIMAESRRELATAAKVVRGIHGDLYSRPDQSLRAADDLVDGLASRMPDAADTLLHAVNDKTAGAAIYNHSVNVAILALLLANRLGFSASMLRLVGLGALFHDVGMAEVPALVRNKTDDLTPLERSLIENHCLAGARVIEPLGMAPEVLEIVRQHHELVDGSGYPRGLRGDQVGLLARLLAIIELYEQFCNCPDPKRSLMPHEAMSQLFARYRSRLDAPMLQAFIHMMGVYPPGSIVALSNGSFGKVLSVHPDRPLQPVLMIFDPEIPRDRAVPVDMALAPKVEILRAVRPNLLSPEAFAYLMPHRRAIYFFGSAGDLA